VIHWFHFDSVRDVLHVLTRVRANLVATREAKEREPKIEVVTRYGASFVASVHLHTNCSKSKPFYLGFHHWKHVFYVFVLFEVLLMIVFLYLSQWCLFV